MIALPSSKRDSHLALPQQSQHQIGSGFESIFQCASSQHRYGGRIPLVFAFLLWCAFGAEWGLTSCNDAPGPLGSELLPTDSLTLRTITNDSLPLIASTSLGRITPKMASELAVTSSTNPFFVGAAFAPDGDRFTATAYIRYQLPIRSDSIRNADYAGLTANDIIDAQLFLRPATCLLGDTIGKVTPFNVYEIRQRWYNDSITRVSTVPPSQVLQSQTPVTSYNQILSSSLIDAGNILSRKRPFTLRNKTMIANWINSDSTAWANNVFGLAFVPTNAATAVFGFSESSYILVRFRRKQDTTDRYLTISEDASTTVANGNIPQNPLGTELMVQGGTAGRTALLFDLTTNVPALSTIHRAELILPIDTVRSLISTCGLPASVQLSFSMSGNNFVIDTSVPISAIGQLNTTTGTARYIFTSGTNDRPNMIGIIQRLVKTGGKGQLTLHLTPQIATGTDVFRSDEEQMFNRIVFRRLRGSTEPAFRPRLTVTYSLRPK